MSSPVSFLASLLCILHTIHSADFEATIVNSTGSFWITSFTYRYFKYGSITCPASYCHIACFSFPPYHGNNANTCEQLQVYALSPLTTLYMYCGGTPGSMSVGHTTACNSAVIHADTAKSVTLLCGDRDDAIHGGG
eukprot:1016142_1